MISSAQVLFAEKCSGMNTRLASFQWKRSPNRSKLACEHALSSRQLSFSFIFNFSKACLQASSKLVQTSEASGACTSFDKFSNTFLILH